MCRTQVRGSLSFFSSRFKNTQHQHAITPQHGKFEIVYILRLMRNEPRGPPAGRATFLRDHYTARTTLPCRNMALKFHQTFPLCFLWGTEGTHTRQRTVKHETQTSPPVFVLWLSSQTHRTSGAGHSISMTMLAVN